MILVRLSAVAEADLVAIIQQTKSEWGDEQAKLLKVRFQSALVFLSEFPHCGRATRRPSVYARVIPKLPFVILYKLDKETITILQIKHTKRDS
jgi:plasmid stabilization system protein ParE